jgi:hypothetical protein
MDTIISKIDRKNLYKKKFESQVSVEYTTNNKIKNKHTNIKNSLSTILLLMFNESVN